MWASSRTSRNDVALGDVEEPVRACQVRSAFGKAPGDEPVSQDTRHMYESHTLSKRGLDDIERVFDVDPVLRGIATRLEVGIVLEVKPCVHPVGDARCSEAQSVTASISYSVGRPQGTLTRT